MPRNLCLPALALLLVLPARADESAGKGSPQGDGKPAAKTTCCAGEEGSGKALCPKGKAKRAGKKTAPAPEKPAAAKGSPAPGAANMIVTRDAETGELRNATAAERAKLFAGRAPQAAPAAPRVVILPDGTEMVELGESAMSYALATKAPDGSVKQSCVHGPEAAAETLAAPRPAPAPRAEER